jgi:Flp pilus assembly protein TadD
MRQWLPIALLAFALAGCQTLDEWSPFANGSDARASTTGEPANLKFVPSNEPLKTGLENFERGDYGLAERHFRDAVEKNPRDTPAWIGLAASYDRLGRYEFADRAYDIAISLTGETTEILNNQGYSYMLRGNLKAARAKLMKAYKNAPDNPTVLNNIKLLNLSQKMRRRES